MASVTEHPVPEDSMLARFGGPNDYRDCFCRDVPHTEGAPLTLPDFIERFYNSASFLPERMILKLIAGPSSRSDARAFAQGKTERFGAWKLVERTETEMLAVSKDTNTASWFCVPPPPANGTTTGQAGATTRVLFGSWVGGIDQSGWRGLLHAHQWYSRFLLSAV